MPIAAAIAFRAGVADDSRTTHSQSTSRTLSLMSARYVIAFCHVSTGVAPTNASSWRGRRACRGTAIGSPAMHLESFERDGEPERIADLLFAPGVMDHLPKRVGVDALWLAQSLNVLVVEVEEVVR